MADYCDREIASTNAHCKQILESYDSVCPNDHLHWQEDEFNEARGHKFDVVEEL